MGSVNVPKLKGILLERGLNVVKLGQMIGYDKSSIYRRLEDSGKSMTVDDANLIIKALKLTKEEAIAIFFSQFVPNFRTTQE